MTKLEFMQEAALRLVATRPDVDNMCIIVGWVKDLTKGIFNEEEIIDADFEEEPRHILSIQDVVKDRGINELLEEIDKIETIDVQERNVKQIKRTGRHDVYFQKGGYAKRIGNVFKENNIDTIGMLLGLNRNTFSKLYKVGKKSVGYIDKALYNLYGITNW